MTVANLANFEVPRQCAWCLLIVDQAGEYTIQATGTVRWATHGICPSCKVAVRAESTRPPLPRDGPIS